MWTLLCLQTKAFQLVTAELEARSNKAARQQIEVGASQPIKFSFLEGDSEEISSTVEMPEDSFVNVLRYLDGHELAKASCVSKVWLSLTRLPIVWEDGVDMRRLNQSKVLNMTGLLKLLQRPQFANVKAFAFPMKVKMGENTMKQLAKALPHLETLDLLESKAKDRDLVAAIENFPSLKSLRVDTWNVSSGGLSNAVRVIGEQLLELRIVANLGSVSGHAIEAISSSCSNLSLFSFRSHSYTNYPTYDGTMGDNIVALVKACCHLHTLELYETNTHVKQSHFVEVAELVSGNLEVYALRNILAYGNSGVTPNGKIDARVEDPFDICEVLSDYTFLNVQDQFIRTGTTLSTGVIF